ncbi:MAG: hypothetical protein US42_C0005G0036 [Candidatus Magasanikbacteria bacterium GW2011_GWC2_37_14]|uniref:Uncharacterized protein n=1 Tax=Candidatus Magasanikbacteria bacterium GW2011_GWC2_37_14 TaxID=1619046 RepID=A0A0G0JIE0_9BACT|nr:MAG: hypothetical protein US42_C0005G0036 [Candidatus Magasanikbacteria bacterium GW2011_GWC2_37_14]
MDTTYQKMSVILRPGLRVANAIQGKISFGRWQQTCRKIDNALELLGLVLQRDLEIQQIVIPYVSDFLDLLDSKVQLLPYKGVSYNPYVAQLGENLALLDFFGYIKRTGWRGLVLNASPYAVVNQNREVPATKFTKQTAKEVCLRLTSWFQTSDTVLACSKTRGRYLEAISLSLFPQKNKPIVIDANDLWLSERYQLSLQEAIQYCSEANDGEIISIKNYANYNRYDTEYQRWYSILVLAEVIYLYDVFGVNIKIGPTTESNFDDLIRQVMKKRGSQFAFVCYDRQVEKVVSIADRISFTDSSLMVSEKFNRQPMLESWLREIINPFGLSGTTLEKTIKVLRRVNEIYPKVEVPQLNEGGFLNAFPFGECD